MARSPATRATLLARLRDRGDPRAWSEFVEVYAPLVFAYGRRRGLQEADASDLVQEVLRAVAMADGASAYDPDRGSFRGWLLAITRHELGRLARRGARGGPAEGGTTHLRALAELPDEEDDDAWEREHRSRLFAWASERVRGLVKAPTWEAFWRTAVGREPPEVVAADLGMTTGAVYIARSRVLARMRDAIATLEGDLSGRRDSPDPVRAPGGRP